MLTFLKKNVLSCPPRKLQKSCCYDVVRILLFFEHVTLKKKSAEKQEQLFLFSLAITEETTRRPTKNSWYGMHKMIVVFNSTCGRFQTIFSFLLDFSCRTKRSPPARSFRSGTPRTRFPTLIPVSLEILAGRTVHARNILNTGKHNVKNWGVCL